MEQPKRKRARRPAGTAPKRTKKVSGQTAARRPRKKTPPAAE